MFNLFRHKKNEAKLFYHTDVHCHILPGVDHGAQSLEDSLEMLRAEKEMGIERVILTSHVTASTFENTPETLLPAFELLKKAVAETDLDMELHVSAEYRIDEFWQEQYQAGNLIAMPGNYLLMENSFQQELLGLDETLFDLKCKGYNIMLAHPERYAYYAHRKQRLEQLHGMGIKFQINILSLAGYYGPQARETALWLVKNNQVDLLGSDMHNMEHAHVIKEYIGSKDWRKLVPSLQAHVINDLVH
ncbi:MAG: hypothetical protein IJ808_04770 [Muribaculaceae bacterium]|nr:hypothetical protein [Muribaculaceae bacterium]